MEKIPVAKNSEVITDIESAELREKIERARELRAELEMFNGKDVVGKEELDKVETIAHALSLELQDISAEMCLKEGLPYHPTDLKTA
ncbi:hypothetical protein H6787_00075 [Candidatus Nomurabacteria bacterium]|nr:hypothetical protein [Candidatus Nomurabacteria bacterium]